MKRISPMSAAALALASLGAPVAPLDQRSVLVDQIRPPQNNNEPQGEPPPETTEFPSPSPLVVSRMESTLPIGYDEPVSFEPVLNGFRSPSQRSGSITWLRKVAKRRAKAKAAKAARRRNRR